MKVLLLLNTFGCDSFSSKYFYRKYTFNPVPGGEFLLFLSRIFFNFQRRLFPCLFKILILRDDGLRRLVLSQYLSIFNFFFCSIWKGKYCFLIQLRLSPIFFIFKSDNLKNSNLIYLLCDFKSQDEHMNKIFYLLNFSRVIYIILCLLKKFKENSIAIFFCLFQVLNYSTHFPSFTLTINDELILYHSTWLMLHAFFSWL